ncbi:MAG: cytochrome c [Bacteroidia bacterium]|nr:cytochrome c [Bacteroidia bacterium]
MKSYQRVCGACHQPDGSGVPGMYPPLKQTEWVLGDPERLINIVLNGLNEEIEVNGVVYKNAMPPQNYLNDQEIAGILTYVRNNFGNEASEITPGQVAEVRKKVAQ